MIVVTVCEGGADESVVVEGGADASVCEQTAGVGGYEELPSKSEGNAQAHPARGPVNTQAYPARGPVCVSRPLVWAVPKSCRRSRRAMRRRIRRGGR